MKTVPVPKVELPKLKTIRQMPKFWYNFPEYEKGEFLAGTYLLTAELGTRCREDFSNKVYTNKQSAYVAARILALKRDRSALTPSGYGVCWEVKNKKD